jgi:kynurenine 3-monooxygenase
MPGLNRETNGKRVAVCGGGLVGCLAACYFADRNYDVTLYEFRSDLRQMKVVIGRSINMAMSQRGREGLRGIGAEEAITSKGIEMYSRMLHDKLGRTSAVPYGKQSECILSIDRRYLNELLITGNFTSFKNKYMPHTFFQVLFLVNVEAEKRSNIKIEFNHKLTRCDTNSGQMTFEK